MADYDIITVGGGLAGAALARSMALAGKKVLIVEGEKEFRDRVRGEEMTAWGVADTKELGIYDLLTSDCAREMRWWDTYLGPMQIDHRDLPATTPGGCANLTFYHPAMQERLLGAAAEAGAEVLRGVQVRGVEPGDPPAVTLQRDGKDEQVTARIVAGCDGRNSSVRKWGGFETEADPNRCVISGLFVDEVEDTENLIVALDPGAGIGAIYFPQAGGRVRTYLAQRASDGRRFSGEKDIDDYMTALRSRLPGSDTLLKDARPAGPLATFNGAENWVGEPYRDGVALVGDAAGTTDPTWGQGLSLTVHDVRLLRDALLATEDWDSAGRAYAEKQHRDYDSVRRCEGWFTTMFYDNSPEANTVRSRAMPLIAAEQERVPDTMQVGPEVVPATEEARKRFFGED
jgi:2-polyprenyl-6-methoxyphenol hydroxylase-like FAD-dependent oxidoreductase